MICNYCRCQIALSSPHASAIIQEHMQTDVRNGDWFLFFNASRDYLKAMWHDGTGFNIHAKKLDAGQYAQLASRSISRSAFDSLLKGAVVTKQEKK